MGCRGWCLTCYATTLVPETFFFLSCTSEIFVKLDHSSLIAFSLPIQVNIVSGQQSSVWFSLLIGVICFVLFCFQNFQHIFICFTLKVRVLILAYKARLQWLLMDLLIWPPIPSFAAAILTWNSQAGFHFRDCSCGSWYLKCCASRLHFLEILSFASSFLLCHFVRETNPGHLQFPNYLTT